MAKPYPANQYILDPRQNLCWESFANPKSKTFGNAYKSAVKAGYTKSTALHITKELWFTEKSRRHGLLSKAEKVLDEMLELPTNIRQIQSNRGKGYKQILSDDEEFDEEEESEEYVVTEPALVKIKQDTAKFIAERLGKDDGYSTRTEKTGANGAPIEIDVTEKQKIDEALNDLLDG